jgi:hypothetical protein
VSLKIHIYFYDRACVMVTHEKNLHRGDVNVLNVYWTDFAIDGIGSFPWVFAS